MFNTRPRPIPTIIFSQQPTRPIPTSIFNLRHLGEHTIDHRYPSESDKLRHHTGPSVHMGSPIENLPVELLIDIIIESQIPRISKDKSPFENVIEERPVTNWVPLMLVCRRFRDVIVDVPGLWSRLPVTNNLVALQRRLFRSQVTPLDLLFSVSCESALPFLLPHAPRIRAIIATPRFHINLLPSLIPLLNVSLLTLERAHVVPIMDLDFDSKEWHKLRDAGSVFNETSHPRVKMVTSYRLLLPPKDSGFWSQKLLHLDIRSQYGDITAEHRDNILTVLTATPLLESLAITFPEYGVPPDFGFQIFGIRQPPLPVNPPREPTPLWRLRSLTLFGPTWLSGPVLHGIDYPSLERLYIHCTTSHPRSHGSAAIVDMFPNRLRRILAQHSRLHIHAGSDGKGFRMGDCHCETGRVSSDRFYLRVHSEPADHRFPLHVLCHLFKEASLETLEVNYFMLQRPEGCGGWKEVLETFPGLRKVALCGNDQKSGAAMVAAIEALQKEGLNTEMELVVESAPW